MSVDLNATVSMRYEINHGLLVLQVVPDEELPPFVAGQYTTLGLPASAPRYHVSDAEESPIEPGRFIRRAYSIASSSLQGKFFEFFVALVRTGALTPRLFALGPGDRIHLGRRIVGMFTLDEVAPDKDIILVATGTGLAPYLSMLRSRYAFDAGRRTVVVHGSRVSYDLGYRSELEGMAARYEHFHYLPIIDQPERNPGWTGQIGFVQRFFSEGTVEKLLGRPLTPESGAVFLCGNPLMVQGMLTLLGELGLTKHSRQKPGDIFVEEYWK
jgi:ferredoxin/flavodoxin---NADP+ reductase